MISGWLESNIVSIITVGASVVYFISKIDSSNKANRDFFQNEIHHISELLKLNHQTLQGEIQMLKEKNEMEFKGIKDDINRLEVKQSESNNIKERTALLEASLKSLHKRIDKEEN